MKPKHRFRSIGRGQVDQCSTKTWQIFRKESKKYDYKNLELLVVIEPKLTKKTTT